LYSQIELLDGFLLEEKGDHLGAKEAWVSGTFRHFQEHNGGADLEGTDAHVVLRRMIMTSLADAQDGNELSLVQELAENELPVAGKRALLAALSPDLIANAWKLKPVNQKLRLIARNDMTFNEQLLLFTLGAMA
jgi:hypothetical protein